MTIAELRGKLNPARPQGVSEKMEDLLTSDVFGTMKYAGWDKGFIDWIETAEVAPVTQTAPPISALLDSGNISRVYFKFWPTLKNGREPDLAMLVEFEKQNCLLIVVEVKYFSGTSDWDDEGWAQQRNLTGSQLADQVLGLYEMSDNELLQCFDLEREEQDLLQSQALTKIHLFITTHSVLPVLDYEKARGRIKGSWPLPSYWLSWNRLSGCLKKHFDQGILGQKELIKDLHQLLGKKGLVSFSGFSMSAVKLKVDDGSFWNESYWAFERIIVPKYQSFLSSL